MDNSRPRLRRRGRRIAAIGGAASLLAIGGLLASGAFAGAATSSSQQWMTSVSTPTSPGVGQTMTGTFGDSGVTATIQVVSGTNNDAWPRPSGPLAGANVDEFIEPDVPADSASVLQGVVGDDAFTQVITFNKPVIAPILHVANLDSSFVSIGGRTTTGAPISLSTLSKNDEMDVTPDGDSTFLNRETSPAVVGGCQANDGSNPVGACGSFVLGGGPVQSFMIYNQHVDSGDGWVYSLSFPTASLTKSFDPSTITEGDSGQLSFFITNPVNVGQPDLSPLDFTDTLPAGVTMADSAFTTNGQCGTPSVTNPAGNALSAGDPGIRAANLSVAAGATCIITVNVTSSTAGTYTNDNSNLSTDIANLVPDTSTDLVVVPVPLISLLVGGASLALGAGGLGLARRRTRVQ
ncbi:hypothetical protein ABZ863_12245 [Saccharomonospora sp. NPDC046836]|uniref:DUF7933 domain-containing protein n=1 Tax=Saccharomonospora sp. NPDC046836 TaxID=3156921 RepID=UPI0033D4F06C